MTNLETRKAQLREYIDEINSLSSIKEECVIIAEQLLECIEALEKIAELPKGDEITELDGWYAKRKAEALLNEIAGEK